ncbi:hypothetical protein Tco_1143674 [Tanacetum coccineum]
MGNRIRTRNSPDMLLGMILQFEFLSKRISVYSKNRLEASYHQLRVREEDTLRQPSERDMDIMNFQVWALCDAKGKRFSYASRNQLKIHERTILLMIWKLGAVVVPLKIEAYLYGTKVYGVHVIKRSYSIFLIRRLEHEKMPDGVRVA